VEPVRFINPEQSRPSEGCPVDCAKKSGTPGREINEKFRDFRLESADSVEARKGELVMGKGLKTFVFQWLLAKKTCRRPRKRGLKSRSWVEKTADQGESENENTR